jgi:hypothetical protein
MSQFVCHSSQATLVLNPLVNLVIFNVNSLIPLSEADKQKLRIFTSNLIHLSKSTVAHVFIAIILLRRLTERVTLVPGSMFLLVSIVLILSRKLLDDSFIKTNFWSRATGIPVKHLNQVEREFLGALDFNTHISSKEYAEQVAIIIQEANFIKASITR